MLEVFDETGIECEQLLGIDRSKVEETLDVVPISESEVYDMSENEYVRKAEVDEECRETRL